MTGTGAKSAFAIGVLLALASGGAHAAHGSGAGGGSSITAGSTSTGANVALGQQMAAARGWTGRQWSCLDWLWTRESGWRMVWNYGGSGAYGIPQALPASKMASAGADYMTNPATEIRWGLGYIRGTYGTPCVAWGHEVKLNWY